MAPVELTPWGALWYNGPQEIQVTQPPTGLNGLATPADLKAMQDAANAKLNADMADADVWNVPVTVLLRDAQEALIGVTSDLLGQSERRSLRDILTHGNRLRGLGVAFIVLAILGMLLNWLIGGGTTVVVRD
jgi:hypothetical protein